MKPILKALLLADHVYEDKETGKKIIAGTLTRLGFSSSERAASACAYISLMEVRGPTRLTLRYVDLEDNSTLLEAAFDVNRDNPLDTIEIIIRLPSLPAPHAGDYVLELLSGQGADQELLGSHRLRAIEVEGEDQ